MQGLAAQGIERFVNFVYAVNLVYIKTDPHQGGTVRLPEICFETVAHDRATTVTVMGLTE
jgi:hypothetical protein